MSNLPHNHELERQLLSCLLCFDETHTRIFQRLQVDDFHYHLNKKLFEVLQNVHTAGGNASLDIAYTHFHDNMDMGLHISGLVSGYPVEVKANLDIHLDQLILISSQRVAITQATLLGKIATTTQDSEAFSSGMTATKAAIAGIERRMVSGNESSTETAIEAYDRLQKWRMDNPGALRGLSTGIKDLDGYLDGMRRGKIYVIGGRAKMGKSSLMLSIFVNVIKQAKEKREKVAIFSLEMDSTELVSRMISIITSIPEQRLTRGQLTADEWQRQNNAKDIILSGTLIDTDPSPTPDYIKSRIMGWQDEGYDILIAGIDHIGRMSPNKDMRNDTANARQKWQAVTNNAKEMEVTTMVLSQLNRGLENRPDKRPTLRDLEYSGAAEQEAQAIMFAYRDVVYNENSLDENTMEVIVKANRDMPLGVVECFFKADCMAVYPAVIKEINL